MKHTVHKLFWAWDFEKEEQWLNSMSTKGLHLVGVGFCKYIFEEGMPGDYIYRLELLNQLPSHIESSSYIHFLEETGVQHIGSYFRWVYLRKKSSDGKFDVYSDYNSRINHLKRIMTLIFCTLVLEISPLISTITAAKKGSIITLILAILLGFLVILLSFGLLKILIKMRKLKKEHIMFE